MADEYYFFPVPQEEQKKEKNKARELRKTLWWRQQLGKGECYYCRQKFKSEELTMDHVIPIARGGKSNKKNCVPCCKDCNNKKGYKTQAELTLDKMKETSEISDSNRDPEVEKEPKKKPD